MKSLIAPIIDKKDALTTLDDSYFYSGRIQMINALPPMGSAIVTAETSLNFLAKEIFNDEKLSWVISVYNGVTDDDIEIGMELSYPNPSAVNNILNIL